MTSLVEPFLKTGTTISMAQSEGIDDEDIDALKIHDKWKDISEAIFLNNTLGKLSTPPIPLILSFYKILKTLPGLKKTEPTLGRKSEY